MQNNSTKAAAWVALILSFLMGLMMLTNSSASNVSSNDPNAGSLNGGATVINNPYAFTSGFYLGNQKGLTRADAITITPGQNQVAWKNNSAGTVFVRLGDIEVDGVASSTERWSVGTSTTATKADTFSPTAAQFWSQFIDNVTISTSTQPGVWADNIANHKTSWPGTLEVVSGEYIFMSVESFCKTVGGCETATSSNRGWNNAVLPFEYWTQ